MKGIGWTCGISVMLSHFWWEVAKMMGGSGDMTSRLYSTAPKFSILEVQRRALISSGDVTCLIS